MDFNVCCVLAFGLAGIFWVVCVMELVLKFKYCIINCTCKLSILKETCIRVFCGVVMMLQIGSSGSINDGG